MPIDIVTSPDDELQFSARHRPALLSGEYTVQVTQTLNIGGTLQSFESDVTTFAVFSPRFVLRAEDVVSVYPPADSSSQYGEVLPHVILNRPTLPWERTCEKGSTDTDRRPWLALLVFNESELAGAIKQVKVSDLLSTPAKSQPLSAHLDAEMSDPEDDSVTVIDLQWSFLGQILPAVNPDETSLICHVRSVKYAITNGTGPENAIVIATRLPPQNSRVLVHLVSLENCYEGAPLQFLGETPKDSDMVRLISLYSWQFFCQTDSAEYFSTRMKNLNTGRLNLPSAMVQGAGAAKQEATALVDSGFIMLRHRFRQGDSSVSWYHSPLLPGPSPAPLDLAAALPCTTGADTLLLYDSQHGMLDASYAAAWELGRMLMLENSLIASALFEFRRAIAQAAMAKQQSDENADALYIQPPGPAPDIPANVQDWISQRLALFQSVPFNYLVPDEAYLPQESLRFFTLDQTWRKCLVDGALSVGRFEGDTSAADSHLQANLSKASSGLLMRSAVVSAFPGLLIDAYAAAPASTQPPKRLNVLRRDTLSPNILLVIFEEDAAEVDFHLSPESIHFGVDHPDANGVFHKTLRTSAANNTAVEVPFRSPSLGVIDMRSLATRILQETLGKTPSDSDLPKFAVEMIESVPMFKFSM